MTEEAPDPERATGESAGKPLGCQPSLEEIYQYMDGVMADDRQVMVRTHLSHCSGCDDFYHFHTGLRKLVGQRCRTEPPATLSQRIFEAIAAQQSDPRA